MRHLATSQKVEGSIVSLEFFIGIRKEKNRKEKRREEKKRKGKRREEKKRKEKRKEKTVSGSLYSIKKKHEILINSSFEDDDSVKIILFQDILMILFLPTVVVMKVK